MPRQSAFLPKTGSRHCLRFLAAGVSFLAVTAAASAGDIDTTGSWDGTVGFSSWGFGATQTYGQTITATSSQQSLTGFTFNLKKTSGAAPNYKAFVYQWDTGNKRITGDALFESSSMLAPDAAVMTAVTINTGAVTLQAGQKYVLFLTTAIGGAQPVGGYSWGRVTGTEYADGEVVYTNNTDFSDLSSQAWDGIESGYDFAFLAMFGAVQQHGGQNAIGFQTSGTRIMNDFMALTLNPFTGGRGGFTGGVSAAPGTAALGYAKQASVLSEDEEGAYAVAFNNAPDEGLKRTKIWGSAYGGYNKTDGGASAPDSQSRGYGTAFGADFWLSQDTMIGAALGIGSTSWDMSGDSGSGGATVYQGGVYGRHMIGQYFVGASLAATYQDVDTNRVAGGDLLTGDFDAYNIGGRVEAGYRYVAPVVTLTPYGALQMQNAHTPAYTEDGSSTQAVRFEENDTLSTRTELGFWVEKDFGLENGNAINLFGRAAWAHNFNTDPSLNAAFSSTPGSGFLVTGAETPSDLAVFTAGAEFSLANGWSMTAELDGEFAHNSQSYKANGKIAYRW